MAGSFSAQIASAVADIKGGLDAVVMQSAQDVLNDASLPVAQGGNMPVQFGFLRNSLVVAINSEPSGITEKPKGYNEPDRNLTPVIEASIAGYQAGDTIMARWTANYAVHQEYGSNGRAGRAFMRQAAQKWQMHITKNANILLARFNGR